MIFLILGAVLMFIFVVATIVVLFSLSTVMFDLLKRIDKLEDDCYGEDDDDDDDCCSENDCNDCPCGTWEEGDGYQGSHLLIEEEDESHG